MVKLLAKLAIVPTIEGLLYRTLKLIFFPAVALLLGTLIYLVFRYEALGASGIALPHWVLYSLPDGLWMYAFVAGMVVLWNRKVTFASVGWIVGAYLLGLLYEMAQQSFVPGTYDGTDMLVMALMGAMGFLHIKQIELTTNHT